jgi:hypothetical protein
MAVKKGEDRPSASAKEDIRERSRGRTHIGYDCTTIGYMRNIEMQRKSSVEIGGRANPGRANTAPDRCRTGTNHVVQKGSDASYEGRGRKSLQMIIPRMKTPRTWTSGKPFCVILRSAFRNASDVESQESCIHLSVS